jgi:hypothetical protein
LDVVLPRVGPGSPLIIPICTICTALHVVAASAFIKHYKALQLAMHAGGFFNQCERSCVRAPAVVQP